MLGRKLERAKQNTVPWHRRRSCGTEGLEKKCGNQFCSGQQRDTPFMLEALVDLESF
jgi:hypothetical protein